MEDVTTTFLGLTDTPSSYAGNAGKILRVNEAQTAVEALDYPADSYTLDETSNYETTSTSFVDVDAVNLSISLDTKGGQVWVILSGTCFNTTSGQLLYFDVDLDGGRIAGDDGMISMQFGSLVTPIFFVRLVDVAAGSHTLHCSGR